MQTLKEVYKDFPVESLINIEDSNLYCKVENAMIKNAVFSVKICIYCGNFQLISLTFCLTAIIIIWMLYTMKYCCFCMT